MLLRIVAALHDVGGNCYLVGGGVRDLRSGNTPKDLDVEVYGLPAQQIVDVLSGFGSPDVVGATFGVIKISVDGYDFDFSIPRRESKNGSGHKGFIPEPDPHMTINQACSLRDYTCNAQMYSFASSEFIDLFGGDSHFRLGVLKHTSERFAEDPLRVLRGMQFAGRFNMTVDVHTATLCNRLRDEYGTLSKERIFGEWYKWATKSTVPSMGLMFLCDTGWIELYPELFAMYGVEQDPVWHPEVDCFQHTYHVVDCMSEICDRESIVDDDRAVLMLAALCHDMAKPFTTEVIDGRIRSLGHEKAGKVPAIKFLSGIGIDERHNGALLDRIIPLVTNHLAHGSCQSAKAVRRLAVRLGKATIRELCLLIEADASGRPPLPKGLPESAQTMLELSRETRSDNGSVKPILFGRHLLELGLTPGKTIGEITRAAFEAQLDGCFDDLDGALMFARSLIEQKE